MPEIVQNLFLIFGIDITTPPATFAELIPWFLMVTIGLSLIWWVLDSVRYWVNQFNGGRML